MHAYQKDIMRISKNNSKIVFAFNATIQETVINEFRLSLPIDYKYNRLHVIDNMLLTDCMKKMMFPSLLMGSIDDDLRLK